MAERKFGAGALKAAGYQGMHEIGEALKAFPDSISVTEPGTLGAPPTPQEVYESKMGPDAPEPSAPEPKMEPMPSMPMPEPDLDRG